MSAGLYGVSRLTADDGQGAAAAVLLSPSEDATGQSGGDAEATSGKQVERAPQEAPYVRDPHCINKNGVAHFGNYSKKKNRYFVYPDGGCIQNWTYFPPKLPENQSMRLPGPAAPFVFFHIPKCAGSTLERFFFNMALKLQVSFVKPCGWTGKPTVNSVVGYKYYPNGFVPIKEQVQCGQYDGCAEHAGDERQKQVLRISLGCAGMIIGHFRPNLLYNLKATQQFIRSHQHVWATGGEQNEQEQDMAAKACAEAGDKAFCETDGLYPQQGEDGRIFMKAPYFDCVTSVREPIARMLSHNYHFNFMRDANGTRHCDTWESKCAPFHTLSRREKLAVIESTGGNVQLIWLTAHMVRHPTDWVGHTIERWVYSGMQLVRKCAVAMVDRWEETTDLFSRLMPWAGNLTTAEHLVPGPKGDAGRATQRQGKGRQYQASTTTTTSAPRLPMGAEELPLMRKDLPTICTALAPDVFFFLDALTAFELRLRRFGLRQRLKRESHVCEPILKRLGITKKSKVTLDMFLV